MAQPSLRQFSYLDVQIKFTDQDISALEQIQHSVVTDTAQERRLWAPRTQAIRGYNFDLEVSQGATSFDQGEEKSLYSTLSRLRSTDQYVLT